jgi:hypothetical protein
VPPITETSDPKENALLEKQREDEQRSIDEGKAKDGKLIAFQY